MQNKILDEFERIGIKAVKEGKMEKLEEFLEKIVREKMTGAKHE